MTNISKHQSEHKRKSNNCKETRISFLIPRNTISIYYCLESRSERISLEICRRAESVLRDFFDFWLDKIRVVFAQFLNFAYYNFSVLLRSPK